METAEQIKTICMHIQPQAYFTKKPDAVSTDFISDIMQKLGRDLAPEEREALGVVDDDVDIISRD